MEDRTVITDVRIDFWAAVRILGVWTLALLLVLVLLAAAGLALWYVTIGFLASLT